MRERCCGFMPEIPCQVYGKAGAGQPTFAMGLMAANKKCRSYAETDPKRKLRESLTDGESLDGAYRLMT
jgi:hypothetical protein